MQQFHRDSSGSSVGLALISPNDPAHAAARIHRATGSTSFGDAVHVHAEYGAPNLAGEWSDAAPGVGDHSCWIEPINGSGGRAHAAGRCPPAAARDDGPSPYGRSLIAGDPGAADPVPAACGFCVETGAGAARKLRITLYPLASTARGAYLHTVVSPVEHGYRRTIPCGSCSTASRRACRCSSSASR